MRVGREINGERERERGKSERDKGESERVRERRMREEHALQYVAMLITLKSGVKVYTPFTTAAAHEDTNG